jgi:hypothetical protein
MKLQEQIQRIQEMMNLVTEDEKVICGQCNHSWKLSDGGE